ncbi:MAG: EAL domain-containing protein [Pseudoflavonifractor sp.]
MADTGMRHRKGQTIFWRMLVLLLTVLLLQMLIYLVAFFGGGTIRQTQETAFDILSERTENRTLDLENDMLQRWSHVEEGKSDVLKTIARVLKEQDATIDDLLRDSDLSRRVLGDAADSIVDMLRRNSVTGAFLVLENSIGDRQGYPGLYIRDYDPLNFAEDNADLLLERGLPEISRAQGIPMDSYWTARFHFDQQPEGSSDFYFRSLQAAKTASRAERGENYYYRWSNRFSLSPADRSVIAYSVPLVWPDGTVIGVIGVDLTIDYLADQLKYDELGAGNSGAYYLGISRDGGATYERVCDSGPNFQAYYGQPEEISVLATAHQNIVTIPGSHYQGKTIYGALQPLRLYNNNTPFEGERWALIGMMSDEHLFHTTWEISVMILLSTLVSLVIGLVMIFFASRTFTQPIAHLMDDLVASDPEQPIRLRRTNYAEIDRLSKSIEDLSDAAAESASRISKIVSMSHIPVGVFEYRRQAQRVFCSRMLYSILGWPEQPEEDDYLPNDEFRRRITKTVSDRGGLLGSDMIFHIPLPDGKDRWVQIFYRVEEESVLGAFLDVTEDVESKRKMAYERDYDVLTGLHNRRAFDQGVDRLFDTEGGGQLGCAALIMMDLDNLKYVNDTYGHDYGDRYIQAFAHSLTYFYDHRGLVGRRSGDEFNVLIYGYETQAEIRRCVSDFWALAGETYVELPDGGRIRVRASGGLAWYPQDAKTYTELLRLSDFAMYNIKHTVKGMICEFDQVDYQHKSILIQGQDALNRMLDSRMVRYALQPIVSTADGSVYGYEFLMRPMLEQISDLKSLFLLAKAQSKLLQIEELTWFEAMDNFSRLVNAGKLPPGTRAFINSIGNQRLTEEDIARLENRYRDLLPRVVMEITEGEKAGDAITAHKHAVTQKWGAMMALDDYGTGYNSEAVLVSVAPDIVKVDISIIHQIDGSDDRRALLRNLVNYAGTRGIRVLAEGVETAAELDTVMACGVDFVQGYYLARPIFEVPEITPEVQAEICALHRRYAPPTT